MLKRVVIPAKAGIYRQCEAWIPAFAGMTIRSETALFIDFDFSTRAKKGGYLKT
jgi:hypothetical protein